MKISRWEGIVILLCAVFLSFTAGWFVRAGSVAEPLRVESQRRLEVTHTALPAPVQTPEREKVNINTATVEELATLPEIGEKRAADIVAEREANGPYRFPEDITRVMGIGEEIAGQLLEYITTGEEIQ